jgi:predicted nucleic acid-binding protein
VNEFCNAMMSPKRTVRLTPLQLAEIVRDLLATGEVVPLAASVTVRALRGMPTHGLSFWDALIWATAKQNGIPTIYTEDFQHGRDVEGVHCINPFLTSA